MPFDSVVYINNMLILQMIAVSCAKTISHSITSIHFSTTFLLLPSVFHLRACCINVLLKIDTIEIIQIVWSFNISISNKMNCVFSIYSEIHYFRLFYSSAMAYIILKRYMARYAYNDDVTICLYLTEFQNDDIIPICFYGIRWFV